MNIGLGILPLIAVSGHEFIGGLHLNLFLFRKIITITTFLPLSTIVVLMVVVNL